MLKELLEEGLVLMREHFPESFTTIEDTREAVSVNGQTLLELDELGELLGVTVWIRPALYGIVDEGDIALAATTETDRGEISIYIYMIPVIFGEEAFNRVLAHELAHILSGMDEVDHTDVDFQGLIRELLGEESSSKEDIELIIEAARKHYQETLQAVQ